MMTDAQRLRELGDQSCERKIHEDLHRIADSVDRMQRLLSAVEQCIADHRDGYDVLASDSWDRVCHLWDTTDPPDQCRLERPINPNMDDEMVKLVGWVIARMTDQDHGCLTGDCPHENSGECDRQLLSDFKESEQLQIIPGPSLGHTTAETNT